MPKKYCVPSRFQADLRLPGGCIVIKDDGCLVMNGFSYSVLEYAQTRCGTTALSVWLSLCNGQQQSTISLASAIAILQTPRLGDALMFSMDIPLSFGGHAWVMRYETQGWAVYQSFLGYYKAWRMIVDGQLIATALKTAATDTRELFAALACHLCVPKGPLPGFSHIKCTTNRPIETSIRVRKSVMYLLFLLFLLLGGGGLAWFYFYRKRVFQNKS